MNNHRKNISFAKIIYIIIGLFLLISFFYLNINSLLPSKYSLPSNWELNFVIENHLLLNCILLISILLFLPYKKLLVWKTKIFYAVYFSLSFIDIKGIYPISEKINNFYFKYIGEKIPDFQIPYFLRIKNFYNSLVISTWNWEKYIERISPWLILIGILLVFLAWIQLYNTEKFTTNLLYSLVRHPQYTGIFLIVTGWAFWKTTTITVILYFFLVLSYYFLARREEIQLKADYGIKYWEYFEKTL